MCQVIATCSRWGYPAEWRGRVVAVGSSQPTLQWIEGKGKCESSHAHEGRGEAGGSKCNQGIENWEANSNVLGQGETEWREAKCRQLFVEGREDAKYIGDCGGIAREEGNTEEEGSVEEWGTFRREALLINNQTPTRRAQQTCGKGPGMAPTTIECKIQNVGWIDLWVFVVIGFWVFAISVCPYRNHGM